MAQALEDFKPQLIVCRDPDDLSHKFSQLLITLYSQAIFIKGFFTVVLAGGTTPQRIYAYLSDPRKTQTQLDWGKIHFFFGDERYVPKDHPESNFGMVSKILFSRINIPNDNVHPILTSYENPDEAGKEYEKILRDFFKMKEGEFPSFDLILLGIGQDGHTASLFSGTPALEEKKRWVVASFIEKLQTYRITMTPPLFNHGKTTAFLVTGKEKARVLKALFNQKDRFQYPAGRIRPVNGSLLFYADQAAAQYLAGC